MYVNPHGRPVNTRSAPSEVKLVDTKTLLTSQENNRSRTSFTNDKTNDRSGSSLSVLHEHKGCGEGVDGLLSSSSSHSVASDRGSEKDDEPSSPDRKKRSRSMKKLRDFGSDIKRALSRSRNSSPIREETDGISDTKRSSSRSRNTSPIREKTYGTSDTKRALSRSRNSSPIRDQANSTQPDGKRALSCSRNNSPTREQTNTSPSKRAFSRSRNNSPTPERNNTTVFYNTDKSDKVNDQKKQTSCDDLIKLRCVITVCILYQRYLILNK